MPSISWNFTSMISISVVCTVRPMNRASIGNSRSIYETGILSHVNDAAKKRGARSGMAVKDFVEMLLGQERK